MAIVNWSIVKNCAILLYVTFLWMGRTNSLIFQVLVMASQEEHSSEPILPHFFPASLHMHNQLNKGFIAIPDFLPSSKYVGPDALPDYLPSHMPALIATALKWTSFFHNDLDYGCRLSPDDHALTANLDYHSYCKWLESLYDFFSLPFEHASHRKQRLLDGW